MDSQRIARPVLVALAATVVAGGCTQATLRATSTAIFFSGHALLPDDQARLLAPHGIRGVRLNGPLAWIIPTSSGVVVVDTGYEEDAHRLRAQLGASRPLAVLLTHGHLDHAGGAAALGDVPVYVGRRDLPLVHNTHVFGALMPRLAQLALGAPPAPQRLIAVDDGDEITIDGARFRAIHLPGHTPGSTAWLYFDCLFTGDAIVSIHGSRIVPAPAIVTEDFGLASSNLRKLPSIGFRYLCDSHFGCIERARIRIPRPSNSGA